MAEIEGTPADDVLLGTPQDDTIKGLGGNDYLQGEDGRDSLYGGDGNDTLSGRGSSFSFELDRVLSGGSGDDLLIYANNDAFGSTTNPPVTLLDGGAGIDTVTIESGLAFTIDISDPGTAHTFYTSTVFNGTPPAQPFYGVTLVGVERLNYFGDSRSAPDDITGGALSDTLSGGYGDDILRGMGGDDDITGGQAGHDSLLGGNGNDLLSADFGDKLIDGGDGVDRFFYTAPNQQAVTFSLQDAAVDHTLLGTTIRNVESFYINGSNLADDVTGGALSDSFYGDDGGDRFAGGGGDDQAIGYSGNDLLIGDAGNDFLSGEADADVLHGGADRDVLSGGDGDDVLFGDAGADVLYGGSGADTFVFGPGDSGVAFSARDRIMDFKVGVDHIDLSLFDGASVTLVHGADYDRVKIDVDGDLKTDVLLQVATVGGMALTMNDLYL